MGANIIYAKDHYFDVEGDFALWWEKQVKKAEDDGVALAVLKSHICAARTWQWKVWFNTIEEEDFERGTSKVRLITSQALSRAVAGGSDDGLLVDTWGDAVLPPR